MTKRPVKHSSGLTTGNSGDAGPATVRSLPDAGGPPCHSKAEMTYSANCDSANAAPQIAREELNQMTLVAPLAERWPACMCGIIRVVSAGQPIATSDPHRPADVVFSIPENLFKAFDIRNAQYRPVVRINAIPDVGSLPLPTKSTRQQRQQYSDPAGDTHHAAPG